MGEQSDLTRRINEVYTEEMAREDEEFVAAYKRYLRRRLPEWDKDAPPVHPSDGIKERG